MAKYFLTAKIALATPIIGLNLSLRSFKSFMTFLTFVFPAKTSWLCSARLSISSLFLLWQLLDIYLVKILSNPVSGILIVSLENNSRPDAIRIDSILYATVNSKEDSIIVRLLCLLLFITCICESLIKRLSKFLFVKKFTSICYELARAGLFSDHKGLAKNLDENKLGTCRKES